MFGIKSMLPSPPSPPSENPKSPAPPPTPFPLVGPVIPPAPRLDFEPTLNRLLGCCCGRTSRIGVSVRSSRIRWVGAHVLASESFFGHRVEILGQSEQATQKVVCRRNVEDGRERHSEDCEPRRPVCRRFQRMRQREERRSGDSSSAFWSLSSTHLFRILSFGKAIRRSSPVKRIVCSNPGQCSYPSVSPSAIRPPHVEPVDATVCGVLEVGPRRFPFVDKGPESLERGSERPCRCV